MVCPSVYLRKALKEGDHILMLCRVAGPCVLSNQALVDLRHVVFALVELLSGP